ncbi:MAG TPA: L-lactate permease [Ktedonobacteraceae bacterium]|jgi:L-lactate permease|nr:L-lactate permease [Ktedonobacteraceae bacterium]
MFQQVLNPLGNLGLTVLAALIPIIALLVMLAVFRITAWLATLIGSIITLIVAIALWRMPVSNGITAYLIGSANGIWAVDWITFWGLVIFNTLKLTGLFETFKNWLIEQATADVRVQAILLAWSLGALLEGLVGFGYPWAVIAPILVALGVIELDAIRVAAIANNAPVSYGALGAPIIALAAVTGLPLLALSASVGKIVAILALLPPWVLIYLVAGRRGFREGWPLALVGSLAYILGQFPTSQFLGPYLPDIIGALVSFGALLLLLRVWRPKVVLGYGGVELSEEEQKARMAASTLTAVESGTPVGAGAAVGGGGGSGEGPGERENPLPRHSVFESLLPFLILIVVVVLWTGPWSPLPKVILAKFAISAAQPPTISHKLASAAFSFTPFIAGTSILVSWLIMLIFIRPSGAVLGQVFRDTFHQMWGALLVGVFIFGLAFVFNYSGMATSLAYGFSKVGPAFILLAPILGWIGVALSGSNTSTNSLFGLVQVQVGRLLGFPVLILPSLNSVGAEVGKPVAPQTASVGVSTTRFVRNEGQVIRHNMGWTLVLLAWLILVGLLYYFLLPGAMRL